MSRDGGGDYVVVDAGGTKTRLGCVRGGVPIDAFATLDSRRLHVARPHEVLAEAVTAHAAAHDLELSALVVGIPGMLDARRDTISHCNNIPAFEGAALRGGLSRALGVPVLFEQDIMLQLLGEWRAGVARGHDSVFGVYFGTGIGSAWLRGGDPFRPRAAALQAGHVPLGDEGVPCRCGNTDCVEAYASGHVLQGLAHEHGVPIGELFAACHGETLTRALERVVRYQAFLLATVVTLLEPDMIVIGGGVPAMPGYPRERLLATARRHLQKPAPAEHQRFGFAALAEHAPQHGAVVLTGLVRERARRAARAPAGTERPPTFPDPNRRIER